MPVCLTCERMQPSSEVRPAYDYRLQVTTTFEVDVRAGSASDAITILKKAPTDDQPPGHVRSVKSIGRTRVPAGYICRDEISCALRAERLHAARASATTTDRDIPAGNTAGSGS